MDRYLSLINDKKEEVDTLKHEKHIAYDRREFVNREIKEIDARNAEYEDKKNVIEGKIAYIEEYPMAKKYNKIYNCIASIAGGIVLLPFGIGILAFENLPILMAFIFSLGITIPTFVISCFVSDIAYKRKIKDLDINSLNSDICALDRSIDLNNTKRNQYTNELDEIDLTIKDIDNKIDSLSIEICELNRTRNKAVHDLISDLLEQQLNITDENTSIKEDEKTFVITKKPN